MSERNVSDQLPEEAAPAVERETGHPEPGRPEDNGTRPVFSDDRSPVNAIVVVPANQFAEMIYPLIRSATYAAMLSLVTWLIVGSIVGLAIHRARNER